MIARAGVEPIGERAAYDALAAPNRRRSLAVRLESCPRPRAAGAAPSGSPLRFDRTGFTRANPFRSMKRSWDRDQKEVVNRNRSCLDSAAAPPEAFTFSRVGSPQCTSVSAIESPTASCSGLRPTAPSRRAREADPRSGRKSRIGSGRASSAALAAISRSDSSSARRPIRPSAAPPDLPGSIRPARGRRGSASPPPRTGCRRFLGYAPASPAMLRFRHGRLPSHRDRHRRSHHRDHDRWRSCSRSHGMADHGTAGSADRQRQGSRRCGPVRHSSPFRYRDGHLPGRNAETRRTAVARRRSEIGRRLTRVTSGAGRTERLTARLRSRTTFTGAGRAAHGATRRGPETKSEPAKLASPPSRTGNRFRFHRRRPGWKTVRTSTTAATAACGWARGQLFAGKEPARHPAAEAAGDGAERSTSPVVGSPAAAPRPAAQLRR